MNWPPRNSLDEAGRPFEKPSVVVGVIPTTKGVLGVDIGWVVVQQRTPPVLICAELNWTYLG